MWKLHWRDILCLLLHTDVIVGVSCNRIMPIEDYLMMPFFSGKMEPKYPSIPQSIMKRGRGNLPVSAMARSLEQISKLPNSCTLAEKSVTNLFSSQIFM